MLTVNKFMCHIELFIGCIIIGMIDAVLSLIFFVYTILDIINHNSDRDDYGKVRTKRTPYYNGYSRPHNGPFDPFVFFKAVLFIIYFLHFVYCIYLIAAALKKSTKHIKRYLLVSAFTTIATFCEGSLLVFSVGLTEMAVNYFVFTAWNIYFIICVYSYYTRYDDSLSNDSIDVIETQVMRV
ncbi:uncharacterized protein [Chironomus tepperi]|uniref:uncharacterized protein n=1 Tax=Chironomus tepperi TaxID=113505 RepID=UPI00391EFFB6